MTARAVVEAVSLLADLAQAAVRTANNLQIVSSIVLKANAEGRDKLTDDEWAALAAIDDQAREELVAKAKAEGR